MHERMHVGCLYNYCESNRNPSLYFSNGQHVIAGTGFKSDVYYTIFTLKRKMIQIRNKRLYELQNLKTENQERMVGGSDIKKVPNVPW